MVFRTDVYGKLLRFLVAFAGIGCAQLPLHSSPELSNHLASARPAPQGAFDAQQSPGAQMSGTPTAKSVAGSSGAANAAEAASSPASLPLSRVAASGTESLPVGSTASPSSAPNDPSARLQALYREAAESYARVDSYIARLTRREQLNGKDKPEEVLLFKFRKDPWSVYFKWLGQEGKGREVVYVRGQYENKIHTLLAAGDIPLMPAGRRFAVAPDNPFVLSSSRHPIDYAGVGMLIERFGKWLHDTDSGGSSLVRLQYLGSIRRPEFGVPCEAVEQTLPPGVDPHLPRGGHRLWAFDPQTKFPALLITHDETGHEVEYYFYDRFEFPVHLDDDDFNPDKLWNSKREGSPPN